VSAQEIYNGAVNNTSSEPAAQDDEFREVKRSKRHNSNDTSQSAKKTTKRIPTSATVKLPPKAVSTRNFFAPFRTTDVDTVILEQRTCYRGRRLPEKQVGRRQK
jgi:hypothetical protein